jgi:hypothetical protein
MVRSPFASFYIAEAIAAHQHSLNSLATMVLNNRISHDYLLAEQGGACATADTTYCT